MWSFAECSFGCSVGLRVRAALLPQQQGATWAGQLGDLAAFVLHTTDEIAQRSHSRPPPCPTEALPHWLSVEDCERLVFDVVFFVGWPPLVQDVHCGVQASIDLLDCAPQEARSSIERSRSVRQVIRHVPRKAQLMLLALVLEVGGVLQKFIQ